MKALIALVVVSCIVATSCGGSDVSASGGSAIDDTTDDASGASNSTTGTSAVADSAPTSVVDTTVTDGSSDSTVNPDVEGVVLVWTQTGGCAMAGPNCARYEISVDGSVATYRSGETEVANSGTIDASEVEGWWTSTEQVDFDALVTRLGPGELTAAYDGVDFTLELPTKRVELSSVDVEFDQSEPFFASTLQLVELAAKAAPLEIATR